MPSFVALRLCSGEDQSSCRCGSAYSPCLVEVLGRLSKDGVSAWNRKRKGRMMAHRAVDLVVVFENFDLRIVLLSICLHVLVALAPVERQGVGGFLVMFFVLVLVVWQSFGGGWSDRHFVIQSSLLRSIKNRCNTKATRGDHSKRM